MFSLNHSLFFSMHRSCRQKHQCQRQTFREGQKVLLRWCVFEREYVKISVTGAETTGIAQLIERLIGRMFVLLLSLSFEHFACLFPAPAAAHCVGGRGRDTAEMRHAHTSAPRTHSVHMRRLLARVHNHRLVSQGLAVIVSGSALIKVGQRQI